MNAVEIEEAVSELSSLPFDAAEFPFAFLTAFGNKETTVKRLRAGSGNASDVVGGVLQRNNIHMAVCDEGRVSETLDALRKSVKTTSNKCKFILATDGAIVEACDLFNDEPPLVCEFEKLGDHFAYFLALAGISTVKQIKNNPIDVKATGRLNKLYLELLKDNPDWATAERRRDLNQFMARLIFCMFAEDTGIFMNHLFSKTVTQMSDAQSSNTHEVISELFRAMNTPLDRRQEGNFRPWADAFPYVNGGLYAGTCDCPRFSRIARTYLLRACELDWQEINPDIFGSMIQAVADEDERGALGMHYTSVPNILKVLNPLFLDDLREALDSAGDSVRSLRKLRRRIANIRVFDPACGSGNFLVIAYRQLREIEAEIVQRTGDKPKSWIKLENFYGIEIKSFAAEIARLALLIAEFQSDVRLINQREARLNVLPLHKTGQIRIGNALRENWLEVCPPPKIGTTEAWDLGGPTGQLALEQNGLGEDEPIETYICGNPPYVGSTWQTSEQKSDMQIVFGGRTDGWKSLDYVAGWFLKAADYGVATSTVSAFVSTNSICQGQQVPILWPQIFATGSEINFAYTSFKWANLASHNAGVTVVVVGLAGKESRKRRLFTTNTFGDVEAKETVYINAYLIPGRNLIVEKQRTPLSSLPNMIFGNKAVDGGNLRMSLNEVQSLKLTDELKEKIVRRIHGSADFINGDQVYCLWITDENLRDAEQNIAVRGRIDAVRALRLASPDKSANEMASKAHQFREMRNAKSSTIVLPRITSENREYLPVGLIGKDGVISSQSFGLYDQPLWVMSIIASKLHIRWIATICGRTRTDFAYSNTLGWNTFPVPTLTEKNKSDLTRCAEDILLAREAHFPATIADLYDPENMPDDLRAAHDRNDEVLERIYIGRRFRNDTERLEKLFDLYTKMTAAAAKPAKAKAVRA